MVRQILMASVLALGAAGTADAASVTMQSVSGIWNSVEGGKKVKGVGTDRINWGDPVGQKRQSGYGFSAAADKGADLVPGDRFALGKFTHYNNAIALGSGATGAKLSVDIDIMIGSTLERISTDFDFGHLETLNSAKTCADGGGNGRGVNSNGCADRVTALRNEETSETFKIDGVEYAFTISGFEDMSEFWTKEEADNSAMLYGRFTMLSHEGGEVPPAPVPLPAAALLLGAGLTGLGLIARRKRG